MKHFLIITASALLIAACGGSNSGDKKAQLEKLKKERAELASKISQLEKDLAAGDTTQAAGHVKYVALTEIKPQSFAHYIEVQAKVDADENISVSPNMAGVVTRILVKTGDAVKQGQVLAELENHVLVQSIEELQTQLVFANTMFQKQKNLWDQKIGTEVQYLTAKNNKEALEKKLATMNEQLDLSKLKSPINGTVDAIDIKIGQALMPGLPSIRVVNYSSLKVKGEVAESYASKTKAGNSVVVYFPDIKKEIKGTISFSAKVINPLTRTYTVEVKLDNSEEFHPNMIAELKIIDYKNDSALVVPVNVIQDGENGSYLFTSENENGKVVAKKMNVNVGLTYNGLAEIKTGLSTGKKVITTGYQDLNDGQTIQF